MCHYFLDIQYPYLFRNIERFWGDIESWCSDWIQLHFVSGFRSDFFLKPDLDPTKTPPRSDWILIRNPCSQVLTAPAKSFYPYTMTLQCRSQFSTQSRPWRITFKPSWKTCPKQMKRSAVHWNTWWPSTREKRVRLRSSSISSPNCATSFPKFCLEATSGNCFVVFSRTTSVRVTRKEIVKSLTSYWFLHSTKHLLCLR